MEGAEYARLALSLAAGYLLGSLPLAYLAARSVGVNILETGTRNPGAANVFRSVSKKLGAAVFVGDVCKGGAAVLAARALGVEDNLLAASGAAAVVGHMYPLFLRFRGGAALAAAIGGVVALVPVPGAIGLGVGLTAVALLRSSGHAAGIGLVAVIVSAVLLDSPWQALAGAVGLAVTVLMRFFLTEAIKFNRREFLEAVLRMRTGSGVKRDKEEG